jgi:hypothetical protein
MTTSKPNKWFQLILIVVTLVAHLYVALAPEDSLMMWYRIDDAFFYFTTARNITQGFGPTFDRIGTTNGFHPLWMLICIPVFALARFNLVLPLRVLAIVMALFNVGTGLLIYRMLTRLMPQPVCMLAAVFWMFVPAIHSLTSQSGLEMGVNAFFMVWLLYLMSRLGPSTPVTPKQLAMIGVASAFALLSRLDNIFLLAIIGLWVVFRSSPLRYHLIWYALLTAFSVVLSFISRLSVRVIPEYAMSVFVFLGVSMLVKTLVYYFTGLPLHFSKWTYRQKFTRLLIAVTLSSGIVGVVMLAVSATGQLPGFPRSALIVDFGLSLVLIGAMSFLADRLGGEAVIESPLAFLKLNWRNWLREGGIFYGILCGTLLAYMLWSFLAIGTPLPVSGQVKEWWGTQDTAYGRRVKTADSFLGFDPTDEGAPFELSAQLLTLSDKPTPRTFTISVTIVLVLVIALFVIRKSRALEMADRLSLLPLLAGGFIQIWTYNIRSYIALGEWYWIAQMLFTFLMLCVLIGGLIQLLPQKIYESKAGIAVAGLLSLVVFGFFSRMVVGLVPLDPSQVNNPLTRNIAFLRANTRPGDVVGLTGGGYVSYFLNDRHVINLDGLISSYDYYQHLRNHEGPAYFNEIGLKYVFGNPYIIQQTDPYKAIFVDRLTVVKELDPLTLFEYHPFQP